MNKFYLGIDFGGTNVRIITYDIDDNRLSDITKKAFQRYGNVYSEVNINLCNLIEEVCRKKKRENKKLAGIGIAMAALFDRRTGVITKWPNNDKWNNFEIKKYLEKYFQVPVILEDDANAAALGEQLLGAGRGYKHFAYITISTGIGCGIISNDMPLYGHHGWAGEIGHIRVTDKSTVCTCGSLGCLQSVASGPAILNSFRKTKTYQKIDLNGKFDLEDVVALATHEVEDAKRVFYEAGTYIGKAIANMVMLLDIPMIVLGGGVVEAGDIIIKPIQDSVQKSLQNKREIELVCSKLNDINGTLGALSLIDKYLNHKSTIRFKI